MRTANLAFAFAIIPTLCLGGPIAEQFSSGFGGVGWGMRLTALAGVLPGGEHYYANSPGERVYLVQNDEPLLGVPRQGQRVQYFLGKSNEVTSIQIHVPYDRREQLLGVLISSFGGFIAKRDVGISTVYVWKNDAGVRVSLWASRDAALGILSLSIAGPNHPPPGPPCKRDAAS